MTVSLNSIVGHTSLSFLDTHLFIVIHMIVLALGLSSQPWLSAQYTVRLQSAVARSVHLLNKLEMNSRDSAHCRVVGVSQAGVHFSLGQNKRKILPYTLGLHQPRDIRLRPDWLR